ncbi:MAG: hypothetical protein LBE35_06970 [Clostridiales bacterium]|nr:hypothetical protein [Clostridiales bacterium]
MGCGMWNVIPAKAGILCQFPEIPGQAGNDVVRPGRATALGRPSGAALRAGFRNKARAQLRARPRSGIAAFRPLV